MSLPEEQQAQLAEWLLRNMPYHRVLPLIKKQFGVTTSVSALCGFYETVCTPALLARRQRAVTTADQVADEASKKPGRFDQATIDALKQKAFELAIAPGADPRDVKSIFTLVLKSRDQDHDERQLALDQGRFEVQVCEKFLEWFNDAQARKIANSSIGNAEKIAALRQAYFSDVDELEKSGKVALPK